MPPYYYDTDPRTAGKVEDYTLWIAVMKKWRVWNLQKFLIKHRQHKSSLTARTDRSRSMDAIRSVYEQQLKNLGIIPTPEELDLHQLRSNKDGKPIDNVLNKKKQWLEKLVTANNSIHYYEEPYFSEIVGARWFEFCNLSTNLGLHTWRVFWSSPLSKSADISLKKKLRFFAKCLVKK